jgi:hypothetical protein
MKRLVHVLWTAAGGKSLPPTDNFPERRVDQAQDLDSDVFLDGYVIEVACEPG